MDLSEDMLEQALVGLAELLSVCRDPWCIFGGTALYLHGYRFSPIADIDVLMSDEDAMRIATLHDLTNEADGGTEQFRSHVILHPRIGTIAVELMAGFEIFTGERWQAVTVAHCPQIQLRAATVPVASLEDVARIFRLSGRPKDIQRLRLLEVPTH